MASNMVSKSWDSLSPTLESAGRKPLQDLMYLLDLQMIYLQPHQGRLEKTVFLLSEAKVFVKISALLSLTLAKLPVEVV